MAGAVGGAGGNGSNTTVGSLTLTAGAGGQVGSSGTPTQAWPGQPGGNGFPNGEYGQDTSQYGPAPPAAEAVLVRSVPVAHLAAARSAAWPT